MALGIIDETQLEKELIDLGIKKRVPSELIQGTVLVEEVIDEVKDIPETVYEELHRHGRRNGDDNVPECIRKLAAEEAVEGLIPVKDIAEGFGVSASSVNSYKSGMNSLSHGKVNEELKNHVNGIKRVLRKRANNVLNRSLKNISDDKLKESTAKELASIAKDMSIIHNNYNEDVVNDNGVKVIVFRPRVKEEDDYEVIDVQAIES